VKWHSLLGTLASQNRAISNIARKEASVTRLDRISLISSTSASIKIMVSSTSPTSTIDQSPASRHDDTNQESNVVPELPASVPDSSRDGTSMAQVSSPPARGNANEPQSNGTQSGNDHVFSSKHRLIKREGPNHQSRNRVQLRDQHWSVELWSLISRMLPCRKRAGVRVIFSNQAIVGYRKDLQCPCFQFRLFDMDGRHHVVQATCTTYVVTQRSPVPLPLRMIVPADDVGSLLFLSLPNEVVHAIDNDSLLAPDPTAASAMGKPRGLSNDAEEPRDIYCPICGEPYDTVNNLIQHGKYQNIVETHDKFPYIGSHQEVDWDEWEKVMTKSRFWSISQLQEYFETNLSEVICIVEGIDPVSFRAMIFA
jgi:hypothetical protein